MAETSAPAPLLAQVSALAGLLEAVAAFFKSSAADSLVTHHESLRARASRKSAEAELKAARGPRREDWLRLSRALEGVAEEARLAVEESERFSLSRAEALARMACELRDGGLALSRALAAFADPAACAAALTETKKRALAVEGAHRRARAAILEEPNVVAELKAKEIYRRLSQAAELLQQGADAVVELIAVS